MSMMRKKFSCLSVFCTVFLITLIGMKGYGIEPVPPVSETDVADLAERFREPEKNRDFCLRAIVEKQDEIVGMLKPGSNSWLADSIADVVKMAPFDERRKACFASALKIAGRVMENPGDTTDCAAIMLMPAKCLFIFNDELVSVKPSYGLEELLDFGKEHQGHPNHAARREAANIIRVVGIDERRLAPKCEALLLKQLEIEKGHSGEVDSKTERDMRRMLERGLEQMESIQHQGWEPGGIPDTMYREIRLLSRDGLVKKACEGYPTALRLLITGTRPNHSEREELLEAASAIQDEQPLTAARMISVMCNRIDTELDRKAELDRVDQVVAWYRSEFKPLAMKARIARDTHIRNLHSLAGWPDPSSPVEDPKYLDKSRGATIISLLEEMIVEGGDNRLVVGYLRTLRRIYEDNPVAQSDAKAVLTSVLICNVLDSQTSLPITNATITLTSGDVTVLVVTDNDDGNYVFNAIQGGEYGVLTSAPGYNNSEQVVSVGPGSGLLLVVQQAPVS